MKKSDEDRNEMMRKDGKKFSREDKKTEKKRRKEKRKKKKRKIEEIRIER